MSHRLDSVAPRFHPVCTSCADLPLSGPHPGEHRHCLVEVGPCALTDLPHSVERYAGADLEGCCWCGVVTDQGYYSHLGPSKPCRTERFSFAPRPGFFRRLYRRGARFLTPEPRA